MTFSTESLHRIQELLLELGLDGWLLYDFRGSNPIATGVLGLPVLTRRFFALIPARGIPVAVTHRIEQQPWEGWIGESRPYVSWRELEDALATLLAGRGAIAVERSIEDAVPYVDRLPAGVLELIERTGARTVSSGDLVSAFYSRWSEAGLASHRRAAGVLRSAAFEAFRLIGERLASGEPVTEWEIRNRVKEDLVRGGLSVGADAIVAVDANAANPHYAPGAEVHARIDRGNLVLLDLWGKERDDAVYADQTWMAFVGSSLPPRIAHLWTAVRDAREAAVALLRTRRQAGDPVAGFEVDDAARDVIRGHGLAEAFIHRTGHSIDRELHGSGPNIDNLETRDTRTLIEGVGFSIEPGIYLRGEVGLRSEVDVYMGPNGPEVTTPSPQSEIHRIGGTE